MTALLGFRPNVHEGKITGLAAYGKTTAGLEADVWELHQRIRASPAALYDWVGYLDDDVPAVFEPNRALVRRFRAELAASDADIAAATQRIYERALTTVVEAVWHRYGGPGMPLVLSGGGFANVRANMAVAEFGFATTFVCPPMGDEGLAVGAAALARHRAEGATARPAEPALPRPPRLVSWDVMLGFDVDPSGTRSTAESLGVACEDELATPALLADRLVRKATVGTFRGRDEFGPRALGNRSILCAADDPAVNDWLNRRLQRSEFMPFGPVMRVDNFERMCGSEAVRFLGTAAFMTMCFRATADLQRLCPAVVHVDGTCRPQVVTWESHPFMYALLQEYEAVSGLPALVNTSFNMHEEPIVASVEDAIVAFFAAELDFLVLGDTLVSRDANPAWQHIAPLVRRAGADVERRRRSALNSTLTELLETQRDPTAPLRFVPPALLAQRVPPDDTRQPIDEVVA